MKKRTKRVTLIMFTVILSLGVAFIFYCKHFDVFTEKMIACEVRNENNNIITFNTKPFIHDYVNISLGYEDSKNIKDDISFEIINPKGEIVKAGVLNEKEVLKENLKAKSGEWKVKLNLKDNESAMINFGYAVSSSKENNMKFE
ncbi:hypothetical protein [Clostridium chrysemydis]|uniref:hypothetical protein n=1 Tax=Clostridium chrysemydis TaxID=2665504 RepID=UPI003F3CDC52